MGLQTSKPNNNKVLITLLIINLVQNLNFYVFFSFHFQFLNLCLNFQIQLQTLYINFLHFCVFSQIWGQLFYGYFYEMYNFSGT
jgi:hypothetical protein